MRWLFHVTFATGMRFEGDRYAAPSLETEGFIHASFRDRVVESARLYFPADAELRVLVIDPRLVDVPMFVVDTPRGPMPHVHGSVPRSAIRVIELADVAAEGDEIQVARGSGRDSSA